MRSAFGRRLLIFFSVLLFAAILWLGGLESWQTIRDGDLWLYVVVLVLSGVAPALSAWRLRILVHAATGARAAPWRRFFHVNLTGIALGLVLPRNPALLGGKAAYLRTMGIPLIRGTWAVLTENVIDLLFLTAIVPACLLVMIGIAGEGGFLAANAAAVALLLAVALATRGRDWRGGLGAVLRRIPVVARRLPIPDGGFVPGPVRALPMLAVTVLLHTTMVMRAYAIALAVGLDPGWLVFAAAYPLTQLSLALAVAPGALGTLDASWIGLLLLLGLSNHDSFLFTVAMRAAIVVFPLIWFGFAALLTLTISANDDSAEPAAPSPAGD